MRWILLLFAIGSQICTADPAWNSIRLSSDFFAEGASAGDINGDGAIDLVYGPHWWAGPDFEKARRFTNDPGEAFVADKGYSDNFFSFVADATGDGKNDILVYGFPGKEARLYVNPGDEENSNWQMHPVAPEISNESPAFTDIVPGGLPEIICTHDTTYGYYEAGKDGTKTWTWHPISNKGEAGGRFEHGLGTGDVNSDGHIDILQRMFWYENPGPGKSGLWKKHRWSLPAQPGGAQILVDDVDGDGDSDLISSTKAHGYGFAWYEQYEPGKFQPHQIMGETSQDNPFGVCFSQLHALALADIDGDGRNDVVTGKRYLAHQGRDPGGLHAPVLYWFRNIEKDSKIEFVPHFIDDDSGVGVEVTVADLNGDNRPDIISGNKKGLAIHLQKGDVLSSTPELWKVPGGRPQNNYGSNLSPAEAPEKMEVPPGFSVDLIAAEPDLTQPIAMTFDARGRIWVIEGHTYPVRAPDGQGKDRILIFEDTTGDGNFDSRKVFLEEINLASGIEVGFGGVFVGAAPYLLFIPDADGNDIPDGEPEILLDGWGYQDTHETLNAFTWGPDGWLYGCHGVFTHSKVGKPGTPEDQRTKLNAGVWRYHPVTREFDIYAHGTSNPWGVDFNQYGDFFVSACVIPHFYHLTRGGLYQRQAGQHFNTNAFDDIKTIADHAHYAGSIRDHAFWGANRTEKPPAPADTSALGGGHAHCGLMIYDAAEFPDQYRGTAFFHNLHGHRVNREFLEKAGSGYIARHRPDFLLANNHDFIGVGIMQGPDGAVYISDWVDPQTCHHRDVEIWNRTNGRIYRVRHGDVKSPSLDLPNRSDAELVAALENDNAFHARQAQRLLQEREAAGKLNRDVVEKAVADIENRRKNDIPVRLRALWTGYVTGLLTDEMLLTHLDDKNEYIRGWAIQLASPENTDFIRKFEQMAQDEYSLSVRRHLASKLQQIKPEERWILAENLINHGRSSHDTNIPLLCWYGIEPLLEIDSDRAFSLARKTRWPQLKEFISRRGVVSPEGREAIMQSLSKTGNPDEYEKRLGELIAALAKMPPVERPQSWSAAKKQGLALAKKKKTIEYHIAKLGVRFGDTDTFPGWRQVVRDNKRSTKERAEAMTLLKVGKDPQLGDLAREMLQAGKLYGPAIGALWQHQGKETAQVVVAALEKLPPTLRNEAINLLASRDEMALIFLEAVDSGKVSSSLVSPVLLNQFEHFENKQIAALIEKNWTRGAGAVDDKELRQQIEVWKKKLTPVVLAKANAAKGRQTYITTCGTCHKLFGQGIALGPDLTGSNRADLGYLLENVISPGSVVGKDYMLNIFAMNDGSTLSGMIRKQTPNFYTIAMPGGATLEVKKADIKKRTELAQSLMPPSLFDAMPIDQVADLVKYLASPQQVPLPGENTTKSSVPPPPSGTRRIEGESLLPKLKTESGRLVSQKMTGFGPQWSGNEHLWWTGGKPGDVLSLKFPDLKPGTNDVVLHLTTAKDYATVKVTVNGQLKEFDLYTPNVTMAAPLSFEKVTTGPGEPLQIDIHITGKNAEALPRYMVGIDRIEIVKPQ